MLKCMYRMYMYALISPNSAGGSFPIQKQTSIYDYASFIFIRDERYIHTRFENMNFLTVFNRMCNFEKKTDMKRINMEKINIKQSISAKKESKNRYIAVIIIF